MADILLITGIAGDAQGWGNIGVTKSMHRALLECGHGAEIAFVNSVSDLRRALDESSFDLIWSALYHISDNEAYIGMQEQEGLWVADLFDERVIPYIGPGATTMKALIHKTTTHRIMKGAGVPVPWHHEAAPGDPLPEVPFPAFVKPSYESRSVGITDESVVHTPAELERQVCFIHEHFGQPALIEEYLPGGEYTVLMLGNGAHQEFLAGEVYLADPGRFGAYTILRADLRGIGLTRIRKPGALIEETVEATHQATKVLGCYDHVRTDLRVDAQGKVKVIEVNGIPGLKPQKSWSPQIYTLYHPSPEGPREDYRRLIGHIVTSALARHGLE